MTTTITQKPATISSILAAAEQRFGKVLGSFAFAGELRSELKKAEARHADELTTESLESLIHARTRAAGVADIGTADASQTAESERTAFLNQRDTFVQLVTIFEESLCEVERVEVGRREKYADAVRDFVIQGGDFRAMHASWATVDPARVLATEESLSEIQGSRAQIVGALSKATNAAAHGRLPDGTSGSEIGFLIEVAAAEIPTA
jgi:hypothetical protein